MMTAGLHPNEEGPRFVAGKVYYWDKIDGRLHLRPWPVVGPDGQPVEYDHLPRGDQKL